LIEEPADGGEVLNRLDPRVKLLLCLVFALVAAVARQPAALLFSFIMGVFLAGISRISPPGILRRLIPVNLFILFLWVFLPFTVSGSTVFSLGPLEASREGILQAGAITVKSNAIMLALIALVSSTSIFTLGHALQAIGVPGKLVHLFFFTFRYIHVIYREYQRILQAMAVRGFRPRTDLHTYRSYATLIGILLMRSFDRAQRVHQAMKCRGFDGRLYSLVEFSLGYRDALFSGLFGGATLGLIWLEWAKTI